MPLNWEEGEIKLPLYGKVIPMIRALPWPIVEVTRRITGIDQSMIDFKSKISKVASSVSSLRNISLLGSKMCQLRLLRHLLSPSQHRRKTRRLCLRQRFPNVGIPHFRKNIRCVSVISLICWYKCFGEFRNN